MEDLRPSTLEGIERRTREIGRELFAHLATARPRIYHRRWWDERLLNWSMRDEDLKVQLFRFVDVLPMLTSDEDVSEHLAEYLEPVRGELPLTARAAQSLAVATSPGRRLLAAAARSSARSFARRFIAGTTVDEVVAAARLEREKGRGFTLDVLGEAVTSELEARRYFQAYLGLLTDIAPQVNAWAEKPQIDQGVTGPLPRMNLSIKLTALDSQFDAIDPAGTTRRVAARLRELLRVARQQQAFINIDMESYDKKDLTLHVFKSVLAEEEFREVGDIGIVIQAYLRDSAQDLQSLRAWAEERGKPVWVRLVKGAYWDYETVHAAANGWPVPVYQEKWQTDANFEQLTRYLLQHHQHLRPAFGSHNLRSLAHAMAVAEYLELPERAFEIQMLYGMGDAEKQALVERGMRLRVYMPYGELIPGMAYLVRRLLENTSNDSFLRATSVEHADREQLLANPQRESPPTTANSVNHELAPQEPSAMITRTSTSHVASFRNQPPVDFALAENRQAMHEALAKVRQELGERYPLVIGGERIDSQQHLVSHDPSQTARIVGTTASASREQAQQAVETASAALPAWRGRPAAERAELLRAAAKVLRRRLFELAAWEVYECGKNWREATADVDEAIDFCEYYAACALDLFAEGGRDVPGEENRFLYQGRGVAAVIAPWNFPIAILCGMTSAALVSGNTVIMKPAEQSPVTAAKLMEVFEEAGFPPGVVNYLPGSGEAAGAALVDHPLVSLIAFTGSRSVGLAINVRAAELSTSGSLNVKRVIAEMGGKNAIIVADDADLDEAVAGVVASAFGYQGQKCSACSRAVVLRSVYDQFLERLIEAARSLPVGPAEDPGARFGPVIDKESLAKVKKYIEIGRGEGRQVLAVDVGPLADQGNFIGPHIFADVSPTARIAQEEIFGPVLAVIPADNLEAAIEIANSTDYALTGGIFSRSPRALEQAARQMQVGNLYLNRGTTGAMVSRQPFGGYRMSGIGSKAGGIDYLLQFVVPRTITENTLRRGFAPPTD